MIIVGVPLAIDGIQAVSRVVAAGHAAAVIADGVEIIDVFVCMTPAWHDVRILEVGRHVQVGHGEFDERVQFGSSNRRNLGGRGIILHRGDDVIFSLSYLSEPFQVDNKNFRKSPQAESFQRSLLPFLARRTKPGVVRSELESESRGEFFLVPLSTA